MSIQLKSFSLTWVVDQGAPPEGIPEWGSSFERRQLPFSEELGSAWAEFFTLALGLEVVRGFYQFTPEARGRLIPLLRMRGELMEPSLMINAAGAGRVLIQDACVETPLQIGRGVMLFRHLEALDYESVLDASANIESAVVNVRMSTLRTLMGAELTLALLEALNIIQQPSAQLHAVPSAVAAHLFSSARHQLSGPMLRLQVQSKALDFINSLVQYFLYDKQSAVTERLTEQSVVKELHHTLMHLEGKVPSIEELAKRYGVSARTLNESFKKEYGLSIYAFVVDARLNAAHDALIHSDVPMKTIAINLGY